MSEENELPEGWVETTLGDVVTPTRISLHPGESPALPYVGLEHVEAESMRLLGTGLAAELKSNAVRFWPDDVLYARLRPYLNKVFRPDFEGVCSPEFLVFRQSSNMNSRYLQYFLNARSFKEFASHLTTGERPRVDWDQLKDFKFPLSPLAEQQRIVESIEEQFSLLDDSTVSLQKDLIRLKRAREAVLKFAVEGKITDEWREENSVTETGSELLARILAERRARWEAEELAKMSAKGIVPKDEKWKEKYKEPGRPDQEKLWVLPKSWCWVTLETIANIQLGKMLSPKAYELGLIQLPYLRNENVRWGLIDFTDVKTMGFKAEELEKYHLKPKDLLVCEGGEAGRCAVYKAEPGQYMYQKALHRVRVFGEVVLPQFLQFCIQHYVIAKIVIPKSSETTIQHIPLEKMQVLPFPLPPLSEQEQIVNEVEMQLSIIAHTEASIEANLKRIEVTRQLILEQAFVGELVEQDPNDEPASVLLERIREERKQREQEEQQRRKEEHMNGANKGRAKRAIKKGRQPLQQVLIEAEKPLTPDVLFYQAGFNKADAADDADNVDDFFEELRDEVVAKERIEVERPDDTTVLLSAREVIIYKF